MCSPGWLCGSRSAEPSWSRTGAPARSSLPGRPADTLCRPRTRSYRDSEVCKYFLCGFCPYEEFRRTKNDCGDCPCMHDEDAKREWDALDDRSRERTG